MTKAAGYAITLGAIVVVVGGVLLLVKQKVGKESAETAVATTQSTQVRVHDASRDEEVTGYDWHVTYQVAGKDYALEEKGDVNYDPSVKYKICYDPANPADGSLARPDVHCGSMF